ncbi:MAG: hypothetical protein Q8K45_18020 [Rubrivivax sp.]|nr:hypothetical protein [Rubrivivax sp.]
MKSRRRLKIFLVLIAGYACLVLPALAWPAYLDTPMGLVFALPYLSVYLFHGIGVPGLLQHRGLCGWGWCAPTVFGWAFLAVFWLGVAWLLATVIARVTAGRDKDD